jgi:hypothetical protein
VPKEESKVNTGDDDFADLIEKIEIEDEDFLESYHGIGSGLTPGEHSKLQKWQAEVRKDMVGQPTIVFDGTGWLTWKKSIVNSLTLCKLTIPLEKQVTEEMQKKMSRFQAEKWKLADLMLQSFLAARLSTKIRRAVTACKDAHSVWNELAAIYASTSAAAQNKLSNEWERITQKPEQTVHEYIQALDYCAMNLESAGIPRTEQMKRHRLLEGLKPEWNGHKILFETMDFTYGAVCRKLIELGHQMDVEPDLKSGRIVPAYFTRQQGSSEAAWCNVCGSREHLTYKCPTGLQRTKDARGRWVPRCFNCLEDGHLRRDCKAQVKKRSTDRKVAFSATAEEAKEEEEAESREDQA